MSSLAAVPALTPGIDAIAVEAVLAGFALGLTGGLLSWSATVVLSIVRRLLN